MSLHKSRLHVWKAFGHFQKNGFPLKHCGNDGKRRASERNGMPIQDRVVVITATTPDVIAGGISKSYFSNASIYTPIDKTSFSMILRSVGVAIYKLT